MARLGIRAMLLAAFVGIGSPLVIALGACGDDSTPDGSDAGCPRDLPSSCPTQVPSYKTDIAPIIERRCFPCHTAGGIEAARHDFSTYDQVYAQRQSMLDQVYSCRMPPPDAGQPTTEERSELLTWFVCHAPDN